MNPVTDWQELVAFARQHSSFYASHFSEVPGK